MNRFFLKTFTFLLCMAASSLLFAQCRDIERKCLPRLMPYIYTAQITCAQLSEKETVELKLTFYAGQDYRILVCGPEFLGDVEFILMNSNRKPLFSSKDHDNAQYWDFKVNSTEEYSIKVKIPDKREQRNINEIANSVCSALLVGFK